MMTDDGPGLPIASTWFRCTAFENGAIIQIEEPFVDPLLRANSWLVRGQNRDLLVDCGLGVSPLRPTLQMLGSADPIVVLTHAHLDHMGSAHEFVDCWAHPLEPVEHPAPGSLYGAVLAEELRLKETLPHLLLTALPRANYDPAAYRLSPATVTRHLHDGDLIDLGDRTFRVLHLPGHSPGSIALFDADDGTLFSGDVIYDDTLLDDIVGADIDDYLASMRRLRRLPVRVVHPGHGRSFGNTRLRKLADEYLTSTPRARHG